MKRMILILTGLVYLISNASAQNRIDPATNINLTSSLYNFSRNSIIKGWNWNSNTRKLDSALLIDFNHIGNFTGPLEPWLFTQGQHFKTRKEAELYLFEYIELFYNRQRLHSSLNYMAPVDYENKYFNNKLYFS